MPVTDTPIASVPSTLLADQVYAAIEQAIFTGALPGGSRLRVRDLAAMVGTSPMPVRDAIRRLEEAGLATRTPHKGAVVRDLTVEELLQISRVLALLEVEGARLGAAAVTPADLRRMEAALEDMQAAVRERRVADALDADEAMLRVLYGAGGNPVLAGLIDSLWKQRRLDRLIGASAAFENGDESLWELQPVILAAAKEHDAARAAEATAASLERSRRSLELRLAAG